MYKLFVFILLSLAACKNPGTAPKQDAKVTEASLDRSDRYVERLELNKTVNDTLYLENTGNVPLVIKDIVSSCGCALPSWEKKPLSPGEKREIVLEITPNNLGFFRKQLRIYCNVKEEYLLVTLRGTVKEIP